MLNSNICKELREELQRAIDAVYNGPFDITIGDMRYDDSEVKISVLAKSNNAEDKEKALQRQENTLKAYMNMHNINSTQGNGYTLISYDSKKRKYPFIATKGGKTYKMSPEQARRTMN